MEGFRIKTTNLIKKNRKSKKSNSIRKFSDFFLICFVFGSLELKVGLLTSGKKPLLPRNLTEFHKFGGSYVSKS